MDKTRSAVFQINVYFSAILLLSVSFLSYFVKSLTQFENNEFFSGILHIMTYDILLYLIPCLLLVNTIKKRKNYLLVVKRAHERTSLQKELKISILPTGDVLRVILIALIGAVSIRLFYSASVSTYVGITNDYSCIKSAMEIPTELLPATFIFFAILPAISEEILFRGLIYGQYTEYNRGLAVFISAFAFTVAHGDFFGMMQAAYLGLLLIAVLHKTDNLLSSILVHVIFNVVVIVSGSLYIPFYEPILFADRITSGGSLINQGFQYMFFSMSGLFLLCVLLLGINKKRSDGDSTYSNKFNKAEIVSIGILLLSCILVFFFNIFNFWRQIIP